MLTKMLNKALISCAITLMPAFAVYAADHTNTDEQLPIQVEDAYPVEYRSMEFQFVTRFEDPDEGGSRFLIRPELSTGIFRNTEFSISGDFYTDTDDVDNTGEVSLLYNLNTETLRTPAFAIRGKAEFDFDGGTDLTARGIVTRTCGLNRFNLNLDYTDIGDPDPGERSSTYLIGLAWDQSIRLDTLLLADIFTQRSEIEGEDNETIAEIGLRYQLNPDTVLLGGLGVGLSGGSDSRDFTASAGFSRSF